MGNFILLFISMFLLWTGLVFPITVQEVIMGVILSGLISTLVALRIKGKETYKISGIFDLIKFIIVFIGELIKANLAMAKIVLSPSLPISPKIVKIKTSINFKFGRAMLANAITLTPGTLTIDVIDDELYIHVVNGNALENASDISLPFEKGLKGAFDK
ncbi:MAG: Na+/H+ antiporter subunit E [Clostridiales bacterium]|nr:Na+/H+ antiporter subunit E [Clostridiales bacterium]